MFDLAVGQVLEFFAPADADGETIAKGARVRVGAILPELPEDKVFVVLLGAESPRTMTVARHVVTLHSRPVASAS